MKPTYNFLIIITLILLSNISYSQSVPSYVPTNGLVGWWGFNGNAQDGSGNGNHGTVNGATLTTDRFGNQNGAYDFDGVNDYIQVGGNYNLLLDSNFSISCWVKATGLNTFNTFLSNASNNQTNVSGWVWGYNYFYQPARIHFQAFPFYNNSTVSQIGNNLINNIWSNVLVTYNKNNGNLIYYLNGQSTDTFFVAYNIFNANLDLFIGNHFQNNNPSSSVPTNAAFTGNLDDIGIWNRALTQQEITNLYNSQLPTQTSLCLPTITTSSPTSVGVDTVVIGGGISNDGGSSIVLRGICYSTSPNPNMGNQRTEDGSGIGSFNRVLRGLNPSTTYYARSYAKNSNGVVVYGNEVSWTTSASLPGVRCPGSPTVTDIDGNIYNTVQIGNQCWTQSNLKVSKYRNGDNIPTGLSNNTWQNTTSGAYAIYNNDPVNNSLFGKLYNHYAVTDNRGLCPTGWHVPSDGEWNILVKYLDSNADTVCINCSQSSIVVGLLKSTATQPTLGGWDAPNTGATNSSGFTALPGALRVYSGGFNGVFSGYWWTSSVSSGSITWYRDIITNSSSFRRNGDDRSYGFSVRCLKD